MPAPLLPEEHVTVEMDMSKHTPGPWRYSVSDYDGEFVITGSNEGGGSVLPILGRTHNWPRNAEANARLIAAAPDLLAALKRYVAATDHACLVEGDNPHAEFAEPLRSALAIIAKAEGRWASSRRHSRLQGTPRCNRRERLTMPKPEFVLVPREPTEEMVQPGATSFADMVGEPYAHLHWQHFSNEAKRIYRAMISAAPPSPSVDEEMLEALKAARDVIEDQWSRLEWRKAGPVGNKIRAAITRATGGKG